MERRSMCMYCRQRLHLQLVTAKTHPIIIRCHACNQINTIIPSTITPRSSFTGSSSSPAATKTPTCIIDSFCVQKLKRKLSATPVSLNLTPSPLLNRGRTFPDGPRNRALLIGVSYKKFKYKLNGTFNDVSNMKDFLINSFSFQPNNVLVLTEEETDPSLTPTKKNIEMALKWLVEESVSGDSLVFYFSGHGLRQPDRKNDERDGFDETICPTDFMKEGMILDNDIHSIIVSPLKHGVKLHSIVDACHSGTILDLPYIYNSDMKKWEDDSPPSGICKNTSGGWVISISACDDDQEAADTSAFTGNTMNGALTYLLIDILKKHRGLTYGDLIDMMQEALQQVKNDGGCLVTSRIFRRNFHQNLSQRPQLSSSGTFDVYRTHFNLRSGCP